VSCRCRDIFKGRVLAESEQLISLMEYVTRVLALSTCECLHLTSSRRKCCRRRYECATQSKVTGPRLAVDIYCVLDTGRRENGRMRELGLVIKRNY